MENREHSDLEQWAQKFGGTAILGFISTLLLAGKFIHHIFQRRGLVFGILVIPPALLSGIIGLVWFSGMEFLDPVMTLDLRLGLEALKGNLINYVFAALILGITCGRAHSQHNASFRGILTSLFHEGMPMVIYSQLLNWGQTTCCLLLVCVANSFFDAKIPSVFAAMVPLGLEAGADITVSSSYKTDWTNTIVEEAESLGILFVCTMGVLMFTFKPYFIAQGWLGKGYLRSAQGAGSAGTLHLQHGTGQAEAFLRATNRNPLSAHSASSGALRASLTASRSFSNFGHIVTGTPAAADGDRESPSNSRDKTLSFDEEGNDLILTQEPGKSNNASLGAHLALIALTAFLSFGVSLMFHLLEIQLGLTTHWLSGVRMFKLTMCCAMLSMVAILQRSQIKFNRDWFMHMCGLMLDLLVIASLSKAHPKPKVMEQTHYLLCSMFVVVCLLWNIFCFLFVARSLFPNYWFERALTLAGDSMGHSYTGLLFARTLDPTMESPVPAAYAYKLLLFFIPSSGAKQAIVASTMSSSGPWAAFFTCLFVVFAWLFIFDSYFRRRFVSAKDKARDAQGDDEASHSLIAGGGDGNTGTLAPVSDDEIELTGRENANTKRRSVVNQQSSKSFHDLIEDAAVQGDRSHTRDLGLELSADHSGELEAPQQRLRAMTVSYNVHASEASSIISQSQMNTIASFLSNTNCAKSWQLTYSLRQHGASMTTLLSLTSKKTRSGQRSLLPCVMVIEDSWGYIFGGFISPNIQNKSAYYGNGECFVYSLVPAPQVYKWTGKNELFVLSSGNCFAMGGGGDGYAIQLDDELDTGVSNRSDTFENKVLSSSEFFKCLNIEVWTLDGGFSV